MQSARGNLSRKGVYVAPDGGEGIPQERVEVLYAEYKAAGTSKRRKEIIRNQLVEAYQSAIKAAVRRFYRPKYHDFDDLVQEANVEVLRVFGNYNSMRADFSTFVAFHAEYVVKRTTGQSGAVRLTGTKSARQVMFVLLDTLSKTHDFLTSREIDEVMVKVQQERDAKRRRRQRMQCSRQEVQDVLAVLYSGVSMNAPLAGQYDMELQDLLFAAGDTPEDIAETEQVAAVTAAALQKALDALTERERAIVSRRRLSDGKPTLTKIAGEQGVTAERIRQVEVEAIRKMRKVLQRELAEVL